MTGEKGSDILLFNCTFIDQGTWYNYIVFFLNARFFFIQKLSPLASNYTLKDKGIGKLSSVLQCIKMLQYTRQVQHTELPDYTHFFTVWGSENFALVTITLISYYTKKWACCFIMLFKNSSLKLWGFFCAFLCGGWAWGGVGDDSRRRTLYLMDAIQKATLRKVTFCERQKNLGMKANIGKETGTARIPR